mmetsp:Transcript_5914/g.14026  ORF Transcript_5914/g.14026 Transcript_5914/m.14026 type:complete len:142 (+) Transcript_5914:48-473(+)
MGAVQCGASPGDELTAHANRYVDSADRSKIVSEALMRNQRLHSEAVVDAFCGGPNSCSRRWITNPNDPELVQMPIGSTWNLLDEDGDGDLTWDEVVAALTMNIHSGAQQQSANVLPTVLPRATPSAESNLNAGDVFLLAGK